MRGRASIILQSPAQDAPLTEVGILQVADPGDEIDVILYHRAEPFVRACFVTGDAGRKLWHQAGMVELLLLVGAKVGLGTGHPKSIPLEDNLPMMQGACVRLHEALLSQREQSV